MKSRFLKIALVCLALLILQSVYSLSTIYSTTVLPNKPGAVIVFCGEPNRVVSAFKIAQSIGCANLIISGTQQEMDVLKPFLKNKPDIQIQMDYYAQTTDANARNTALIVKRLGAKSVVLVTSWYHLSRAAFLMRLYLVGSGVKVYPVAAEERPARFWDEGQFWLESVKFWGSLGRVALAKLGFEKPWFHS